MTVESRHRMRRMKRVFRRFAAMVSALIGIVSGWGMGGAMGSRGDAGLDAILGVSIFGVAMGGVFFLGMLGVMATMQGLTTRLGRGRDDRRKPNGRGS